MRLEFKKIEIHSFMSFEDEIFEFDAHKGITLIRGVNYDIPEETNGAGKCLDPKTVITVEISDPNIEQLLLSNKHT